MTRRFGDRHKAFHRPHIEPSRPRGFYTKDGVIRPITRYDPCSVPRGSSFKRNLQGPIGWQGGKSGLVKEIVPLIPEHETYVEPFFGGGHVYWAKEPSLTEVISDNDPQLMKFYRDLRDTPYDNALTCDMSFKQSRYDEIAQKRKDDKPMPLCEFVYLNKHSYGRDMGSSPDPRSKADCRSDRDCKIEVLNRQLPEIKDRLADTHIKSRDFREVVRETDGPNTFFYVDPPYPGTSHAGYKDATITPEEVSKVFSHIKGRALVSYNDSPRVRQVFKGWRIKKTAGGYYSRNKADTHQAVRELLIMNYDPPSCPVKRE